MVGKVIRSLLVSTKNLDSKEKRTQVTRRKWTTRAHNSFKDKDKEKANVVSSVIIKEPLDAKDILYATMATDHVEVNDVSIYIHAHDIHITKSI